MTAHLRYAAFAAMTAIASSASADPPNASEADRLFHDGQTALDAGRVAEACSLLRDSQRLDPKLGRLLNLAFCHERQGAFAAAWREFSSATAWAAQKGQDERASFARAHAEAVSARLSLVKLEFSIGQEPGAIQIDGDALSRDGWSLPVALDPGEHAVIVSGDHKKSTHLTFLATEGSTTLAIPVLEDEANPTVPIPKAPELAPADSAVPLVDTAPATTAIADESPRRSGGHAKRTFGWISEGFGVAALGAGVYFGLAAVSKKSDADPSCPAKLCDAAGQQLIGEAKTNALISTISLGVGLAALGLGTTMLLTSHEAKSEAPSVRMTPRVGPRSASFGLEGAW